MLQSQIMTNGAGHMVFGLAAAARAEPIAAEMNPLRAEQGFSGFLMRFSSISIVSVIETCKSVLERIGEVFPGSSKSATVHLQ